ncbi:hypothetical protein F01_520158 [Burkholderia cenocepacia]|nr:hypothetical protein F01_520158 [Burkholderia cenocepacia]
MRRRGEFRHMFGAVLVAESQG